MINVSLPSKPPYTLADLLYLMQRLRDPLTGCPWDVKQTYNSITNSTIEEAYEVVDAIEHGDFQHLKEELGDLLFQVVFYSQLAREDELYTFDDVVNALTAKLIRRHPHVFPDGTLDSVNGVERLALTDIKANWEQIKKAERKEQGKARLLDDVPISMPAMTRAAKLQKRAATVGFDWTEQAQVFGKLKEEVFELEEQLELMSNDKTTSKDKIEEELGDVMFTIVNLARHLNLDPERTLRKANAKFVKRFNFVESAVEATGASLTDVESTVMEDYWQQAKSEGL